MTALLCIVFEFYAREADEQWILVVVACLLVVVACPIIPSLQMAPNKERHLPRCCICRLFSGASETSTDSCRLDGNNERLLSPAYEKSWNHVAYTTAEKPDENSLLFQA